MAVAIPYNPRPYQREIHEAMFKHRFCTVVMHRRAGKTVMVINHMLAQAGIGLKEKQGHLLYAYVAPYRNQAKTIAWEYLKHFTVNIPRVINESDLSVTLDDRATVRIFGADNAQALRGLRFDGIVLDEVADMKSEVWDEIVRPALADRNGWAIFIGTPKGVNLFSELYERGLHPDKNPGWYSVLRNVDETGALSQAEVEDLRAGMSDNAFRQEMLCDFAASNDNTLITLDMVHDAVERQYSVNDMAGIPVIMGVDVAREGGDATVFCWRQGLSCEPMEVHRGLSLMDTADRIAAHLKARPEIVHCCIDVGMGAGVIDRLRDLGYRRKVVEVPFGSKAVQASRFLNRRAEMWFSIREWLQSGGSLPNDSDLKSDLTGPTYSFDTAGRVVLEKKEDLKKRLNRSPDRADALCLTFAVPVRLNSLEDNWKSTKKAKTSYDVLEYA